LAFFIWLLPTLALAAEPTYNFPVAVTRADNATASTSFTLPFFVIGRAVALDLGNDGTSELAVSAANGFAPYVFLLRQDGSIISQWLAYDKKFQGGVRIASGDVNNDGKPEIITVQAGETLPLVKIFNGFGAKIQEFSLNDKKYANIKNLLDAVGNPLNNIFSLAVKTGNTPATLKLPKQVKAVSQTGKTIIVNLTDQRLSYYQDGMRLNSYRVSTGRWGFATPIGEFKTQNKIPRAYSKAYGLYMPFWMAFYRGEYGIHELPEWPNGYKEGENHLGTPVSHGCIRLGVGPAKTLYDWAKVGTTVIVQK